MPLGVVYTKSKSVWDDIVPFVETLVGAYQKSQETKWENEWTSAYISDLERSGTKQEVDDILLKSKMPKENLDIEGAKTFANEAMSLLAQKEIALGNLQPGDVRPQTKLKGKVGVGDNVRPQAMEETQLMPDKMEFNDLYKFVSELPTGKTDWGNTLGVFKERLEKGRALGTQAQQLLQMIGIDMKPENTRQKVEQDFNFAKKIQDLGKEDEPSNMYEHWKADPENVEKFMNIGKEKKEVFDDDAFLQANPDMILKSQSSTGTRTYGLKSTSDKKWDFDSWKDAQAFVDSHDQKGFEWKIDPVKDGFNVTAVKKDSGTGGGTKKITPTYQTINTVADDLTNPSIDYDTTMHNAQIKYNLEGVKLPTKADQAERAYNMFEQVIFDEDNEFIDEKGFVNDPEGYADYYKDYEKFSKIYYEQTGEILPKEYLSLEEAGKFTENTWGTGTKGESRPVKNTENVEWNWLSDIDSTKLLFEEMKQNGLTPDDYDLEGLAKKKGIDVERLLQMFKQ